MDARGEAPGTPGASCVLRYITRDGRPGMSWACRVVEDRPDLLALFLPRGTPHKRWGSGPSRGALVDAEWRWDMLRLMFPGRSHSVWLTWRDDGSFLGYYVNLEEPFRRTAIGFDTNDHHLDIIVAPDLHWSLKDEAQLAERLREGTYSVELVAAIREEARGVIRVIEARGSPFNEGWDRWHPDPPWPLPDLDPRWNSEPPALWNRRLWAYPLAADPRTSESG